MATGTVQSTKENTVILDDSVAKEVDERFWESRWLEFTDSITYMSIIISVVILAVIIAFLQVFLVASDDWLNILNDVDYFTTGFFAAELLLRIFAYIR